MLPAAAPIKYDQFDGALQTIVLQAVVGDDDIALGVRGEQRATGGHTIATDDDRSPATLGQEQRFVANHPGIRIAPDDRFAVGGATVTAADDPRPPTVRT